MKRYDELIILKLNRLNGTINIEAQQNNSSTLHISQKNDNDNTSVSPNYRIKTVNDSIVLKSYQISINPVNKYMKNHNIKYILLPNKKFLWEIINNETKLLQITTPEIEVVHMDINNNPIEDITTKMDIKSENLQKNRSRRSSGNKNDWMSNPNGQLTASCR